VKSTFEPLKANRVANVVSTRPIEIEAIQTSNKKLYDKNKTLTIINRRRTITKELVNEKCVLKVVEVGQEADDVQRGKRKLVTCDVNSKHAMDEILHKRLLRAALDAENVNNMEEADALYRAYVAAIRFQFTLYNNSILYYVIRKGDVIEATLQLVEKDGLEIITVDSATVDYRRH
jgi:hypothetical protein